MRTLVVLGEPPLPEGGALAKVGLGLLRGLAGHDVDVTAVAARPPWGHPGELPTGLAVEEVDVAPDPPWRGRLGSVIRPNDLLGRGPFEARVRELAAGNAMLETMSEAMLRVRAELRVELAGLERRLRDLARENADCRLMMTMPGVGPVVALTVKSAIDDPARFRSSKDVGPWAGLTPGRYQSGEVDVVGGITRAGDVGLRTALYQAATVMMHRAKPSWLKTWGMRVAQRRGMKRAVVAWRGAWG